MNESERIKAKVKAREDAREIAAMLSWEDGTGHQYAESFLKEIRSLLPQSEAAKPEHPPAPPPIRRLGSTVMAYGEFAGMRYADIDRNRLDWYLQVAERDASSLGAYLTHPEIDSYHPEG